MALRRKKLMPSAENMFREAALIQLNATCWQLDKQLAPSLLAEVGNVDYLRGRKLLLPPEATATIKQIIGKARNYLRKSALPFPITGCLLVPKKLIPEIQAQLQQLQWEYNNAVEDFIYWYPQAIEDAKACLGELYNSCDYPTREEMISRFRFQWRYIIIGPSGSHILPPSIYKDEAVKFKNLMEQARQEAIASLREEFVNLIDNLNQKLSGSEDGKPKKLRDAAVENLKDFLDSFADRNLFEDSQLAELVAQCQSLVSGTTARDIRTNSQVKEDLHNGMTSLLQSMEKAFENLPRRKLRFAA